MLVVAAMLLLFLGLAHSLLGEKFILIRLFRRNDIPNLFGSDHFTKATLRFAWHLTTIAWFGFSAILIFLAQDTPRLKPNLLYCTAVTFFISGVLSCGFSKGKHLSWIVFWLISALAFSAA